MDKKILVLDIDGTLTNSKKEVTAKTKAKIDEIRAAGHTVMLASGRPTPGMFHIANALDFDKLGGYLLSYNGAKIIKYDTKEVIYQKTLEHQYIKELYDFAKKRNIGIISYDNDVIISGNGIDEFIEIESKINKLAVKEVDDFVGYINYPVNKCLITCEPKKAEEYVEYLALKYEGKLSIYRSEPFFIEIMPLGIDKAASLEVMLPMIGFKREDCIACGDGYNDLTMIKWAGLGVAMANAQDTVKSVADYITLSNDEDGLIPVIDKFIL